MTKRAYTPNPATAYLHQRGITLTAVAAAAGISVTGVYRKLRGELGGFTDELRDAITRVANADVAAGVARIVEEEATK